MKPAGAQRSSSRKPGLPSQYLSPVPLSFRQWDGYEPKPERDFPNQWHLEAGTQERRREIQVLTVIVPYRAGKATPWNARRLESRAAVGVRLERDGKRLVVAFRKAHQPGTARLKHELRQTRRPLCPRQVGRPQGPASEAASAAVRRLAVHRSTIPTQSLLSLICIKARARDLV